MNIAPMNKAPSLGEGEFFAFRYGTVNNAVGNICNAFEKIISNGTPLVNHGAWRSWNDYIPNPDGGEFDKKNALAPTAHVIVEKVPSEASENPPVVDASHDDRVAAARVRVEEALTAALTDKQFTIAA